MAAAALVAWMGGGAAGSAMLIAAATAGLPVLDEVEGLPGWVRPALIAGVVVTSVLATVVVPVLRHRTWRYAIREDEIDLLSGGLIRTRTIVPMARIQHVETQRGLLDTTLGTATLIVHTAARAHKIPALEEAAAAQLRTEIARRARVADDV